MKRGIWPKIGIVIGSLLMLGALGGVIQIARVARWEDHESFHGFLVNAGIARAIQFAIGCGVVWLGVRALRHCPPQPAN